MRTGVVEGFYGRPWAQAARLRFLDELAALPGASFIYAPKADRSLRRDWATPLTPAQHALLVQLREHSAALDLRFGVGISPLGLTATLSASSRQLWRNKIRELVALGIDELWLLFDDMPVDADALAARQLEVFDELQSVAGALQLSVCPGFYCFDAILEQLFGARSPDYWQDLNRGLPAPVDLLWTGNAVLNDRITAQDCVRAADALGRRPLIWDNYPVNDGRKTSDFLHLDAIDGREFVAGEQATGHFINPMVQPALSALVLHSFIDMHRDPALYDPAFSRQAAFARQPAALSTLLQRDWRKFAIQGRAVLTAAEAATLQREYAALNEPAAAEIAAWLAGEYQFDPAVLND